MKKVLISSCSYFKKGKRTFLSIPKGYECYKVITVDGKNVGLIKKPSILLDVILLVWLVLVCFICYNTPTTKQVVQIPNSVYVTGGLLNLDINNLESNPYSVYITVYSNKGDVLYEEYLEPGQSIGAVEINTNYPAYTIEYKFKWAGILPLAKTYTVNNQDYKEE